jgi:tetratricopeptide (TPR) repeat protein
MGATMTRQAQDFTAAAGEFDGAAQASPALPVLAAIARLEAEPDPSTMEAAAKAIASALGMPACPAGVMSVADCQGTLEIGRQWLGWMALRDHRLDEAARDFSSGGWPEWVAGRQAFERRNYSEAAGQYRQAVQIWDSLASEPAPSLAVRLGPRPDLGLALADLGGAEFLAGHTAAAIATLDGAIKRVPDRAWAYYLRARAKEAAGQTDAAFADYNLASRTAFAGAQDLVSGEAHLYRGMLLYRRKDFGRAEDEFASALNFEIPADLRPDAVAWRHLAAVAGGACHAERDQLQRSLAAASPYFPVREAQSAMAACLAAAEGGLQ